MKDPRIKNVKRGHYADGTPLDDIQYLECKLILRPDEFTSPKGFHKFGKLVALAAKECGIKYNTRKAAGTRPQIREVEFFDTKDFRLYNNAFILRRRVRYEDGFPIGPPEIVFKFRHPNLQTAADLDIRPNISGKYRIKFKAEALPLKDKYGGYRLLFSHNVQFPIDEGPRGDNTALPTLVSIFPPLKNIRTMHAKKIDRVAMVNHTIVEEVLQDIGTLDFGKGITANANVALWRTRGEHKALVGEFAFEVKFARRSDVHKKPRKRVANFFIRLQQKSQAWIYLGATKTAMVYRLKGNPPRAHE